jgi:hypothetical protein
MSSAPRSIQPRLIDSSKCPMPTCSIVPCWKLLNIGVELEDKRSSEARGHSTAIDSFYPLTMPVTVGPGSIAVAVGLGSQRPEGPLTLSQFALLGGSAIAGVVALTFTVYVCYRFAKRTTALLDEKRCQCRSCPPSFSRASAFNPVDRLQHASHRAASLTTVRSHVGDRHRLRCSFERPNDVIWRHQRSRGHNRA